MVSTFSPNVNLEEPARGDYVGTWDLPVNANMTLLDLIVGGTATISLNNTNVVLASNQYQCANITFNSTLTGSVTITFPSTFRKNYTIQHTCTGSSAFLITLATTVAGGQSICCPPGEAFDIINDGTNIKFKNFGPQIGGYWDYAGSSVPAWVSGCTVPPYLNCDGTSFSSATYPQLNVIMNGTTLPDMRGRARAYLNQGTTRITSAVSGIDGNTRGAAGGDQAMQSHTHTDAGHTHGINDAFASNGFSISNIGTGGVPGNWLNASGNAVLISNGAANIQATGSGNSQNMPPTAMGGLTLIRAA